jgi:hypothetical protein
VGRVIERYWISALRRAGPPVDNALIESFNGCGRNECLNARPGARLATRRGTVTEIVDAAVDRAPMIGLERCWQKTTEEILKRCRS